jgi:hypothetical protein
MGRECNTHDEMRNVYRVGVGKPEGKGPQGGHDAGGRILNWILEEYSGVVWTGII